MVLRAACSIEASTFPNGVRITDREGRTSAGTEASVVDRRVDSRNVHEVRGGNATRFSLFKWFKIRSGNRDSTVEKRRRTIDDTKYGGSEKSGGDRRSASSSVESVDTFYSTTTVRSFAFHTGTLARCDGFSLDALEQAAEVGPFAAGASKVAVAGSNKENESGDAASTLPANVHRRDITARYSLQPSATFNSCGNLPAPDPRTLLESLKRLDERRARYAVDSTRRRVHVKGKRRAPNPPVEVRGAEVDARETGRNSNRRKRRAPKPPERIAREDRVTDGGMDAVETTRADTEDVQTLSNDTLVLQGGVLLSKREARREKRDGTSGGSSDTTTILRESQTAAATTAVGTLSAAMPRPWYKRSVFEHSRDSGASRRGDVLRAPTSSTIEIKEECGATNANTTTATSSSSSSTSGYSVDASLSRLSFFHRGGQAEDRRREAKRRSGLSILTNISELDKEAAAIVQEEQARARASMLLNSSRFVDAFERRSDANEELVQGIVASAMENSSPRRGTRALISKFNAISNITKVTVNSNFFARNARDQQIGGKLERDVARNAKVSEHANDWKDRPRFSATGQAGHVEKDISRYFPSQQKAVGKARVENTETGGSKISGSKSRPSKEQNDKLASETSNRISFLQSQLAANRTSDRAILRKDAPVTQQEIGLKQEGGEKRETKTSNEDLRGYLFPRNSAESKERSVASSIFDEPRKLNKQQRLDGVQKEFSDIFDEIDKQLRAKEFKFIDRRSLLESATPANRRNKVREEEGGISSKVTKVLDILVEAEKDAKTKSGAPPEKSIILGDTSLRPSEPNVKTKSGNSRSPLLNTIEDPITTDLKEMLKEMKHSLPKRSKPGKIVTRNTDVTEKPVVEKETVNVSDPGKTRYFVSAVTKVESITVPNDYELDKQKVSCSVQTSGNIRRLNQPSTSVEQPSTSGWKQENVLYKTSGKSLGSSGLKNTFQLIRPRDFAEIEATKTTRTALNENTYANVIEQSIYANTHVPPSSPKPLSSNSSRANVTKIDNSGEVSKASPTIQRKFSTQEDTFEGSEEGIILIKVDLSSFSFSSFFRMNHSSKFIARCHAFFPLTTLTRVFSVLLCSTDDNSAEKNMNTLAINRLLRKLEAAIASGHHQQAAGLAKELARLKIHCSVIRQRSARLKDQLIKVNMYIEDKLAHQGPIPLQVNSVAHSNQGSLSLPIRTMILDAVLSQNKITAAEQDDGGRIESEDIHGIRNTDQCATMDHR